MHGHPQPGGFVRLHNNDLHDRRDEMRLQQTDSEMSDLQNIAVRDSVEIAFDRPNCV